jgi:septum formation protein
VTGGGPGEDLHPPSDLILASRSPQRRAILDQLGVAFSVVVPDVEELTEGEAEAVALENARRKAEAVAGRAPGATVLGVDTVVAIGDRIYGKPEDAAQARATLEALSGRAHTVISGLCLIGSGGARTAVARTTVEFRELDEQLLTWYVAEGEWRERAGAYAIQGRGAALITRIEGDYLNVVGLPVARLLELSPQLVGNRGG